MFAGRDLNIIAKCIKEKKPFYALSGIMPTNPQIHLGNKMVVENLGYFQKHGAITFILGQDDVVPDEYRKEAKRYWHSSQL